MAFCAPVLWFSGGIFLELAWGWSMSFFSFFFYVLVFLFFLCVLVLFFFVCASSFSFFYVLDMHAFCSCVGMRFGGNFCVFNGNLL